MAPGQARRQRLRRPQPRLHLRAARGLHGGGRLTDTTDLLRAVVALAEAAGARLAEEFARPEGPRGAGDHAAIDEEIEADLRDALTRLHPARWRGEETGAGGPDHPTDCWLVDPHDGTRAFLRGQRGSAVSIALLRHGIPILGVVYAPLPPDRGPDLFAWEEGMPTILRNGAPVPHRIDQDQLAPGAIVLLSPGSPRAPDHFSRLVAPARYIALPSIAYRLARVAAGDAVATMSQAGTVGHDYAAGHALLRGAGGILIDGTGAEVTYTLDGASSAPHCFGGAPTSVRDLATRPWRPGRPEPGAREPRLLPWPRPAARALDRAVGCLFGQVIGDSLGSLVEFMEPAAIARAHPAGVRDLADGGCWDTIQGQPTDDSELAITLARTLAAGGDLEAIATAYAAWERSDPFDIGTTTYTALRAASRAPQGQRAQAARAAASRDSQANGALMRVAPIGLAARSPAEAADRAEADALLTHPHPICVAASRAFTAAIHTAIAGGAKADMLAAARAATDDPAIHAALAEAEAGRFPPDFITQQGWVLIAFQNAFAQLLRDLPPEGALIDTVGRGGDTDTNGAIAGALLGAAHGRAAWPDRWRLPVLACRPCDAAAAPQPRPAIYWPDDLPALAEALLVV